jgi:predicted Zn finger-like uncharacterized protein
MKFLCGNCKAKYQIADEKVTGRTLRMKCRRCGHDILIDGHTMPQSIPPSAAAPAATPRRSGSTVSVVPGPRAGSAAQQPPMRAPAGTGLPRPAASRSKPPSGLSAEFRRHVAAPPEVPQRTAPYDLWHVAIQDVPVGPMTRDELGRKIEAGAVTPESLCWREGMDDWRPVGELAELAQLLRRTRDASRNMRGRPPPNVPGPGATGSRSQPLPLPAAQAPEEFDEDNAEPTRISEFSPGLALAGPAATLPQQFGPASSGNTSPKVFVPQNVQAPASAPLPEVNTQVVAQPRQPRNIGNSVGMLSAGLLLGILLVAGPLLYRNFWGTPDATPASASVTPTNTRDTASKPTQVEVEIPEPAVVEEKTESTTTTKAPVRTNKPAVASKTEPAKPAGKQLSEEQRKLLERMGGGTSDPDLSKVARNSSEEPRSGGPVNSELTPQQLTKVVQDNKNQLQRCYESALRAAGGKQDSAIKISVNVLVGGSGTAKNVSTNGDGMGNMTDCIRSAVKRWRFPQAQSESEFAFPLVFQPGA